MELSPDDLERISKQYPYFSVAQVLLSKSYQRRKDHRFADQVAQASLYSGNREKLYRYLKEEPETVIEIPVVPISRTMAKEEELQPEIQVLPTLPDPPKPSEQPDMSGLVDFILDDKSISREADDDARIEENVEEERMAIVFHPDEISVPPVEAVQETETPVSTVTPVHQVPEMDDFQREILLEAIQSSIEQEVSGEEDLAETPVEAAKTTQLSDNKSEGDGFAAWVYQRSRQVHFGENAEKQPVNDQNSPDVDDWKHLGEEEIRSEKEVEDLLNAEEKTTLSHRSTKIQSTDYESHKRDLIDRFIRQEPRITRGKTTDYAPGNIAKDSVDEDHLPVTETMAQLYARQGRLDKARKAFKKLIELHPEKSVYFAAQLKNLDKFKKP